MKSTENGFIFWKEGKENTLGMQATQNSFPTTNERSFMGMIAHTLIWNRTKAKDRVLSAHLLIGPIDEPRLDSDVSATGTKSVESS